MTTKTDVWTTRRLLAWMSERFGADGVEPARLVAEMLVAHALDCERMRLYMEADRSAAPDELVRIRELVKRALNHEPVQHIVGWTSFYAREFFVDSSTQIPQPCTEDLVGAALGHAACGMGHEAGKARRVLDIGTGSGCIAISMKLQRPEFEIIATDVVPEALELAARNVEKHGVEIDLRSGSLFEPVAGETFDAIVSNPPYVPDGDFETGLVERCVAEHTAHAALRGGADGLDVVRPLLEGVPGHLKPGGFVIVEVARSHADAASRIAEGAGLADVEVRKDSEGSERFVCGVKTGG